MNDNNEKLVLPDPLKLYDWIFATSVLLRETLGHKLMTRIMTPEEDCVVTPKGVWSNYHALGVVHNFSDYKNLCTRYLLENVKLSMLPMVRFETDSEAVPEIPLAGTLALPVEKINHVHIILKMKRVFH